MTTKFPPRRRQRREPAAEAGCDPVTAHVAARVKLRRMLMGLSQAELGAAVGVTFQQVQKYEKGANRISASTLYRLAEVLDVPVSFFFDTMADGRHQPSDQVADVMARSETIDLVRFYYGLSEPVRRQVHQLVRTMAQDSAGR